MKTQEMSSLMNICNVSAYFVICGTLQVISSSGAFAALYDNQYMQRVGVTRSVGDLSKNPGHMSFQTNIAKTYATYQSYLGIDLYHEVGVFLDSFKTRGQDRLLFPFAPTSLARVVEPSMSLGACAFALTSFQLCTSVGISLAHIQTTIRDYQMYGAYPAQLGFVWKPVQSSWSMELGARYRTLRARQEGYVSAHQDISYSLGFGYITNSR